MVPGWCAGGPTIPPSTTSAPLAVTSSATAAIVDGTIALASTNNPANPVPATSPATAVVASGGQTLSTMSLPAQSASSVPTSSIPRLSGPQGRG